MQITFSCVALTQRLDDWIAAFQFDKIRFSFSIDNLPITLNLHLDDRIVE